MDFVVLFSLVFYSYYTILLILCDWISSKMKHNREKVKLISFS